MSLPRIDAADHAVEFILDTGAMFSVLHPTAMSALGIDPLPLFRAGQTTSGRGIGGSASYIEEEARLTFTHTDGTRTNYILPLHIALPSDTNDEYPSFLGMDFLTHFRMTMHFESKLLELR